jgi:hypothetical protein
MAKVKPRLPIASGGTTDFEISALEWRRIETEYGRSLAPPDDPHQQRAITGPQPNTGRSSPQGDAELLTETMSRLPVTVFKS